ncbi:MAG: hypothetical protein ACTHWW_02150 [Arthrobacter sp.]|uniref:hypothetical protein n=1 Tax=unclassified Arthrobacter TaxID=235627 RepID=UPI00264C6495|nr:hypothetical protein [Micrococcaceae bacterium]MDN5812049.1 hypothetical protein [Micrococcaceae bacterium]MDN5824936.1 hypothetical protein [Micrococcaceae bacterium]MDN5879181.1 hypothetical protein [Micrococcaceae bacterium]MDN5886588.1 hypothetical protein [Micrococcaceae bacterium]
MTADFFDSLPPGERIVIRYRIGGRIPPSHGSRDAPEVPDGPQHSDSIGHFVSLAEGRVTVQTRTGPVTVDHSAITHAKRVPPAPPRRGGTRR